eukprot:TRINITY_DN8657_c0_g2_i1.p1 TRINITY_DN8657_c0_g2~~TRINITY_DN8657_c0_g2_i1.p1  ORF type:complete len:863 (+),score=255.44 TRINITY_DN8657_c0_g2_i1:136-2589(+)
MALRGQRRHAMQHAAGVGNPRASTLIVPEGEHKGKQEPGYVPWVLTRHSGRDEMRPRSTWDAQDGVLPDTFRAKSTTSLSVSAHTSMRAKAQPPVFPYESRSGAWYSEWDGHLQSKTYVPMGIEWADPEVDDAHRYDQFLHDTPESVHLHPHICNALRQMGISKMTRAQIESLYYARQGEDLMLASHPGSGKTSLAVWHVLNKLLKEYPNAPFSTVWLVPNETLAKQTLRQFVTLGKMVGVIDDNTFCLCVESKDLDRNYKELMQHRPSVLIATPNRLGDLIHTPNSPLWEFEANTLQRIIVDEADAVAPPNDSTALGWTILNNILIHSKWYVPWAKYGNIAQQKFFISSTLGNNEQDALEPFYRNRAGKRIMTYHGKYHNRAQGSVSGPRNQGPTEHRNKDFRRLWDDGWSREVAHYSALGLQKDITHVAISACDAATRWRVVAEAVRQAFDKQNRVAKKALKRTGKGVFFRGLVIIRDTAEAKFAAHELYKVGFKGKVGRLENPVALESYANGALPLLISTADGVRGVDLPYLTHVYVACGIKNPQEYIRMAGRVGRAGRSGVCTVVFLPKENRVLEEVRQRFAIDLARFAEDSMLEGPDPEEYRRLLPVARYIESNWESKEHLLTHSTGGSTSTSNESALIKSYMIDDGKSLDTLVETHDPYELQELDMKRNVVLPDGSVKPVIDQRQWPAGTTPGIFYSDEEKEVLHEANLDVFLERDEMERDNKGVLYDESPGIPGGSIHPKIPMRSADTQNNPRGVITQPEDLRYKKSVARDNERILRLVDAQSGMPLGDGVRTPEVSLSNFPVTKIGRRR